MAKFPSERFPPGFFDLPQSAGESLPLEIIAEWTRSSQTPEIARAILVPYTRGGIIVSSDAAGLTRLTRERSLIEILAMLSRPKELIHAYGCAIGGRAVGVWAADNTEMFYPSEIDAERVLAMLRTAMDRIVVESEIGIGMAAHAGVFYELGGGVYGSDADRVELVAEEHTRSGELVVTGNVVDLLSSEHGITFEPRVDLLERFGDVRRVTDGPLLAGLDASNTAYPAPFSSAFTEDLSVYARTRRDSRVPKQAHEELAVVLIEREPEEPGVEEVAVLNNLALTAAMKRIGRTLLPATSGAEVKNAGLIGIYTFADCREAIDFAKSFRDALLAQGVQCRIGIDAGPVLVFELGAGARDIAGSAVNVASKLAQDVGEYGRVQISEAVAKRANAKRERPTLAFEVSGIELRAYEV